LYVKSIRSAFLRVMVGAPLVGEVF